MNSLISKIVLGGELTVSRLGFGTIHLTKERGFGPARKNAVQLLRRAVELGVDFIDTADSYGPETTETIVHEALHPYNGITIATKGGFAHPAEGIWKPNGRPAHLRAAIHGSLTRLHLEQIPLYYLHTPDEEVPYEESLGCLKDLHDAGQIRFVGISNVNYSQVQAARAILGETLVSVQNYYNVMFHHGASDYCPDTEQVLDECELREWAFVAWEPMGTGADLPHDDQEHCRRRAIELISTIAAKHGVAPHVARLAAVLSRSKQIIAIPGTSSLTHLQANMAAMQLSETEDFGSAWLMQRKVLMSLRRKREIEVLKQRLSRPTQDYSARNLPRNRG